MAGATPGGFSPAASSLDGMGIVPDMRWRDIPCAVISSCSMKVSNGPSSPANE
jgi:hypothetical protein